MKILGLDIGSDHVGLALLDVEDGVISSLKTATIGSKSSNRIIDKQKILPSVKMRMMSEQVLKYIALWGPDGVVIEQPFVNSMFPHVAIRLFRLFYHLVDKITEHCPRVDIRAITAPKARAVLKYKRSLAFTVKDCVKTSIQTVPELIALIPDIDRLDEHELDAVVCAYAAVKLT